MLKKEKNALQSFDFDGAVLANWWEESQGDPDGLESKYHGWCGGAGGVGETCLWSLDHRSRSQY